MASSLDADLRASPGYLLALIGAESRRRWTRALRSAGLRSSHFGVLMTLGLLGEASQRRVGLAIGIDPRNLVGLMDQLQGRGLIERRIDSGDRRRHAVRLTPLGHELLIDMRKAGESEERELLAALEVPERKELTRLLTKLLPGLGEIDKSL
jgi:DNA-binding MarR family transcriptional regulator